jgi:hypothetical protein
MRSDLSCRTGCRIQSVSKHVLAETTPAARVATLQGHQKQPARGVVSESRRRPRFESRRRRLWTPCTCLSVYHRVHRHTRYQYSTSAAANACHTAKHPCHSRNIRLKTCNIGLGPALALGSHLFLERQAGFRSERSSRSFFLERRTDLQSSTTEEHHILTRVRATHGPLPQK